MMSNFGPKYFAMNIINMKNLYYKYEKFIL